MPGAWAGPRAGAEHCYGRTRSCDDDCGLGGTCDVGGNLVMDDVRALVVLLGMVATGNPTMSAMGSWPWSGSTTDAWAASSTDTPTGRSSPLMR